MKKVSMVLLFTLVTIVSFGQDRTYVITKKSNDAFETRKNYNAILFLKDDRIELKEFSTTKTYTIIKKQIVNDNLTLCLVKNENTESEFLISEKPKVIEHTSTYTRLHETQPKKSTTFYYFVGNMNQEKTYNRTFISEKEGSFGAVGGISKIIGEIGNFTNFSGGGWIEYKNIGIEYILSASVTDDITGSNYLDGKTDRWITGGGAKSFGAFYKQNNGLYYGGGIQSSITFGLENIPKTYTYWNGRQNVTTTTIVMEEINDKKTLPYFTIGYLKNLGEWFTFKGGILISKYTSVNVGVGYSF